MRKALSAIAELFGFVLLVGSTSLTAIQGTQLAVIGVGFILLAFLWEYRRHR